jgi:uncharacterized phage protein gp47/JayE
MAEFQGDKLYRTRLEILTGLIDNMQNLVPDVWVGEDGQLRILFEVEAGQIEGLFLANEFARDDIFIQTSGQAALSRHGDQWNYPMKLGVKAEGELLITALGGTTVMVGSEFSTEPQIGEPLFFVTTETVTLPNPGDPLPPVAADEGTAGNVTGLVLYALTFLTDQGETLIGDPSNSINITARKVNVTSIPIGGPGTISRKLYRSTDGSAYKLVTEITNNTATTYVDNTATASLGAEPPEASTAERITVAAEAEQVGSEYNVLPATITVVTDASEGVTEVTNPAAFINGVDPESSEEYRSRLLNKIRNPETGSADDLEMWAEEVEGVEEATTFPNDNMGTPTPGHATVRISGPDGAIPDAELVAEVQEKLQSKDLANITIHVTTFTAVPTNVTVSVTPEPNYTVSELTPSVQAAIRDYINSVPVGGTVYIAGIIDAVFGLPGVATVAVTTPASNQTSTATQKRTPGTITVS